MDVPNDDNCLFWAASLALLLPTLNNEIAFNRMYERLFGNTGTVTLEGYSKKERDQKDEKIEIKINDTDTRRGVLHLLLTYDCQKETPLQYKGKILEKLICLVFRNRVVDFMDREFDAETKQTAYIESGKSDWASYVAAMRTPIAWGGEHEICAISLLTQTSVTIYSRGNPEKYGPEEGDTAIYLVHANALGEAGGSKNHYHFGLHQDLYQACVRSAIATKPSSPSPDIISSVSNGEAALLIIQRQREGLHLVAGIHSETRDLKDGVKSDDPNANGLGL